MHIFGYHITKEDFFIAYLVVVKILTAVQDAIDAMPTDLKPPFGKLIYMMNAVGQYVTIGNRAKSIATPKTGA